MRRTAGIVCEPLGDELTALDEHTDQLHILNPTMSAVWQLCDGRRSVMEIAEELAETFDCSGDLDPVQVTLNALAQLDELGLTLQED